MRLKPAAGIADQTGVGIMAPAGGGALEESRVLVSPGLEVPGRWRDLGQGGQAAGDCRIPIDDEGLWVISVVYGTEADEAPAALFQRQRSPPWGRHPLDEGEALEVGKG